MSNRKQNIEETTKPAETPDPGGIGSEAQEGETFDEIKTRLAEERKKAAEKEGEPK